MGETLTDAKHKAMTSKPVTRQPARPYVKGKPGTKTGNKPRRADADRSVKPRARRFSRLARRSSRGWHSGGYSRALAKAFAKARATRPPRRRRVTGAQKRKQRRGLHR